MTVEKLAGASLGGIYLSVVVMFFHALTPHAVFTSSKGGARFWLPS